LDIATCKNQSRASVIICKLTISLVTIDSDNARAYLDHMDAEEEWNISNVYIKSHSVLHLDPILTLLTFLIFFLSPIHSNTLSCVISLFYICLPLTYYSIWPFMFQTYVVIMYLVSSCSGIMGQLNLMLSYCSLLFSVYTLLWIWPLLPELLSPLQTLIILQTNSGSQTLYPFIPF